MIKDTLFYKYISEREGKEVIEDETGFIIYQILGEECFIAEMYVDERARGGSSCAYLLNRVAAIGKEAGCKIMTGNIHLAAKGSMRTLAASLKCGLKVAAANNNILLISREI